MNWKNEYNENNFNSKRNYTFNDTPIKIPITVFTEREKKSLKFIWSTENAKYPEHSWAENAGGITINIWFQIPAQEPGDKAADSDIRMDI